MKLTSGQSGVTEARQVYSLFVITGNTRNGMCLVNVNYMEIDTECNSRLMWYEI